jgi:hypothetical protein
MGEQNSQNTPQPKLEGESPFISYNIFYDKWWWLHQNGNFYLFCQIVNPTTFWT